MAETWTQGFSATTGFFYIVINVVLLIKSSNSKQCSSVNNAHCKSGDECYSPRHDWCNSVTDCSDASDETSCSEIDCPWNGGAIHGIRDIVWCNTTKRCFNLKDKNDSCPCVPTCNGIGQTCCKDGSGCYNSTQRCDDTKQCNNGEDENRCWLFKIKTPQRDLTLIAIVVPLVTFSLSTGMVICIVCIKGRRLKRHHHEHHIDHDHDHLDPGSTTMHTNDITPEMRVELPSDEEGDNNEIPPMLPPMRDERNMLPHQNSQGSTQYGSTSSN